MNELQKWQKEISDCINIYFYLTGQDREARGDFGGYNPLYGTEYPFDVEATYDWILPGEIEREAEEALRNDEG